MSNNIIIVVLLAAIVIGGVFYFSKNQYQPSQQQPTNQQPTTQQQQTTTESNMVTIQNFAFDPATLTVKQGTKVTWTNKDSAPHSIKSDTFNSLDLNQGDKFEFTFSTKGSFDYICGIHPSMVGKIVIE